MAKMRWRGLIVGFAALALTACGGGAGGSVAGANPTLPYARPAGTVSALAGRHLYVGTQNGKFETYDESNGSLQNSLTLYGNPVSAITSITTAPNGSKEYAIPTLPANCTLPLQIDVINSGGTAVLGTMTFQGSLQRATISPDGTLLYAFGQNSGGQIGVFVFNTAQLTLVHSIILTQETSLNEHSGVFLTQNGSTLYVATLSNIYKIPTATLTPSIFAANPIGDVTGFALGANDTKAFVSGLHDIDVFSLADGTMLADIGVGNGVPIFFSLVNSPNEQSLVVDGDPPGGAYFSIVDQTANKLNPAVLSNGGSGAASAINSDGSLVLFYNGGPPLSGVGANTLPDSAQAYTFDVPDFPAAIAAQ